LSGKDPKDLPKEIMKLTGGRWFKYDPTGCPESSTNVPPSEQVNKHSVVHRDSPVPHEVSYMLLVIPQEELLEERL